MRRHGILKSALIFGLILLSAAVPRAHAADCNTNGTPDSTDLAQPATWAQLSPATSPFPRYAHAMAYDSARGVTVLFGGFVNSYNRETWEWNGTNWTPRSPATSPPARLGHAMVYDSARAVTVLFGGIVAPAGALAADTWEWNGTNWTQRSPATLPAARGYLAMTYDAVRGVTVLFGGYTGVPNAETWEWNGTDWTWRIPAMSPGGRDSHVLTYDSVRRVSLLFGGYNSISGGYIGDTWEWNGTSWTQRSPATSPSPRGALAMVYDSMRNVTELFGGYDGVAPSGQNWEWNGTNWTQRSPSPSPSARKSHAMAFDRVRGVTVLFGGYTGVGKNDTWELTSPGSHDCNTNGIPDECELAGHDCNSNAILDACELAGNDCNLNGVPDVCEGGCNTNAIPDACEIAGHDCNTNGTLDVCERTGHDCNTNGTLDVCEPTGRDCNSNATLDVCELTGHDCNGNATLDVCELTGHDCNTNVVLDVCEGITGPATAPTIATASPSATCPGQPVTLTASGGLNGTYMWYSGSCGGTFVGTGSPLVISAPSSSTTYFVRIENPCANSSCKSTTLTVNPNPIPPSGATATPGTACPGQPVTLAASGGSGGTFIWYSGSCGGTFVGTGASTNIAAPSSATTYYVRMEGPCGISTCASVTLGIASLPTAPSSAAASPSVACPGQSVTLAASGGSGGTYTWYAGGCANGSAIGSGSSITITAPSAAATYYVRIEGACGNTSCASLTLGITNLPTPPNIAAASPSAACAGQSVTLTAFGGSGGTYTWYAGSCGGPSVGTGASLIVTAPNSATTYFVRMEGTCGNSSCTSVTLDITRSAIAPVSATVMPSTAIPNQSVTLLAIGGSGGTYAWYAGSCGGTLVGTGNFLNIAAPSSSTTYYVRMEGACGSSTCASTPLTVVTQAPPHQSIPTLQISPNGGNFQNSVQVMISSDVPGANIYYTLDGTTPTPASSLYTQPLTLLAPATVSLTAKAVRPVNNIQSDLVTANFNVVTSLQAANCAPGVCGIGAFSAMPFSLLGVAIMKRRLRRHRAR